jgi:triacylglycerol esterase/lipase EstA (alpha/beta hydrolase family)
MRQQGYDIVIVNFPEVLEQTLSTPFGPIPVYRDGGADYIERNALALVKLINILNQRLQQNGSTEKISIVGPSMGGLISRYALAYMEKN